MVSRRTRIFGLINIFLYSTVLYLAIILEIVLIIAIYNVNVQRKLGELNSEVGFLDALFFAMMIFGALVLLILIALLTVYIVLNFKNYKKLNRNIISYNFFCANLIVSILFTLNIAKSTFANMVMIMKEKPNLLLPLGSLFVLFIPVTGILYSIFGMIDYKKKY